jgi:hypothetical protein
MILSILKFQHLLEGSRLASLDIDPRFESPQLREPNSARSRDSLPGPKAMRSTAMQK